MCDLRISARALRDSGCELLTPVAELADGSKSVDKVISLLGDAKLSGIHDRCGRD